MAYGHLFIGKKVEGILQFSLRLYLNKSFDDEAV